LEHNLRVRAFVHSSESAQALHKTFPTLKPNDIVVGDFLEQSSVDLAMKDVDIVIHIGPPFHPQEAACGTVVIDAARRHGVQHVILSSVLHPLRQKMLNHKVKLEVEEYLIESGLAWTILQPTHMMQNIALEPIFSTGTLKLPYSATTAQGFIDLYDFAHVVLKIVQNLKEHNLARYELLGCLGTYNEVAEIMSKRVGKSIAVERVPVEEAAARMSSHPYSQEASRRMLYYYDTRGLTGSPNILRWLLGRDPSTWDTYLDRALDK